MVAGRQVVDWFPRPLEQPHAQHKERPAHAEQQIPGRQLAILHGQCDGDHDAQPVEFHVEDFAEAGLAASYARHEAIEEVDDAFQPVEQRRRPGQQTGRRRAEEKTGQQPDQQPAHNGHGVAVAQGGEQPLIGQRMVLRQHNPQDAHLHGQGKRSKQQPARRVGLRP